MEKTKVLFVKSKGDIVAVMPYELGTDKPSTMTCYAHVGQHSACSDKWVKNQPVASAEEYKDLLNELVSMEYDVEVITSFDRVGSYNFRKEELTKLENL